MGNMLVNCPSPNTAPVTTGIRLKNPPDPIPFRMAKKIIIPSDEANGQSAIEVTPISVRDASMLFTGPRTVSAPNPIPIRPSADARFHDARIAAPACFDAPIEKT